MTDNFVVGIGGNTTDVSIGNTATSNTFIGELVGNASSADKVNNSLTIGDYIYDGSKAITISKDTFSSEDKQTRTDLLEYDNSGLDSLPDESYIPYYCADVGGNLKGTPKDIVRGGIFAETGNGTGFLKATAGVVSKVTNIGTNDIADTAITLSKLHTSAKYWDETARTNTSDNGIITADWGHLINWSWGTSQQYTFTKEVFDELDTFWETIIFANNPTTILFQNVSFIEMNKGMGTFTNNHSSTSIQIPLYKYMSIKKIGDTALLLNGSYDEHITYYGTTAPDSSLGVNGDIYIKYNT